MNDKETEKPYLSQESVPKKRFKLPTDFTYRSIVLMEMFEKEDFSNLLDSINEIFNLSIEFSDDPEKTFNFGRSYQLSNLKNKSFTSVDGQDYDLGNEINYVKINVFQVMPSFVCITFEFFLNETFSKKYLDIIKQNFKRGTSRNQIVNSNNNDIHNLKVPVFETIIGLLSKFNGYFYRSYSKDCDFSIFPSLDYYLLDFPSDEEALKKWINSKMYFLLSINIRHQKNNFFLEEDEDELICTKNRFKGNHSNYTLFSKNSNPSDIDGYYFEILALDRWIDIQISDFNNLKSNVEDKLLNLNKNNLKDSLFDKNELSRKLVSIERFKFDYKFIQTFTIFKSIINEKNEFFDTIQNNIFNKIKEVNFAKSFIDEQLNDLLNIKNIEFNEENQKKTRFLEIIIVFLTGTQIILAAFQILLKN